jgi:hypothetical protein
MSSKTAHTKRTKKAGRFLCALKRISEDTSPRIAHWSEDGTQFDVVDPQQFDDVLMGHFPNASPRTFFRQLSHYKICKLNVLNGGGDEGVAGSFSLRHPLFVKGHPERIVEIQCRNRKRYVKQDKPLVVTAHHPQQHQT